MHLWRMQSHRHWVSRPLGLLKQSSSRYDNCSDTMPITMLKRNSTGTSCKETLAKFTQGSRKALWQTKHCYECRCTGLLWVFSSFSNSKHAQIKFSLGEKAARCTYSQVKDSYASDTVGRYRFGGWWEVLVSRTDVQVGTAEHRTTQTLGIARRTNSQRTHRSWLI